MTARTPRDDADALVAQRGLEPALRHARYTMFATERDEAEHWAAVWTILRDRLHPPR